MPEEQPKKEWSDEMFPGPEDAGHPFAIGSTGNFVFGGQRGGECTIGACEVTDKEFAVGKNGAVPFQPGSSQELGFGASYKWSSDMRSIDISLHVLVPNLGYEHSDRWVCNGQGVDNNQSIGVVAQIDTDIDLPVLRLHLYDRYGFTDGGFSTSETVNWGACTIPENISMIAKWPTVEPNIAPDAETHARFAGD